MPEHNTKTDRPAPSSLQDCIEETERIIRYIRDRLEPKIDELRERLEE